MENCPKNDNKIPILNTALKAPIDKEKFCAIFMTITPNADHISVAT